MNPLLLILEELDDADFYYFKIYQKLKDKKCKCAKSRMNKIYMFLKEFDLISLMPYPGVIYKKKHYYTAITKNKKNENKLKEIIKKIKNEI